MQLEKELLQLKKVYDALSIKSNRNEKDKAHKKVTKILQKVRNTEVEYTAQITTKDSLEHVATASNLARKSKKKAISDLEDIKAMLKGIADSEKLTLVTINKLIVTNLYIPATQKKITNSNPKNSDSILVMKFVV